MSEQSSTTTDTPAEPLLCKTGCGFFGNSATGNCCSKCWREIQKKKENNNNNNSNNNQESSAAVAPMEVDVCAPAAQQQPEVELKPATPSNMTTEATTVVKKKKKKKTSYKAMMANMTKRTKDDEDIEKEKEGLRKVTGGGAFTKIDHI